MTDSAHLERRYRRLMALYPQAFRREHQEEMLFILMAGARDDRRWPGPGGSADLICSAIGARMRPGGRRPAPTMFWALWLMVLGAALELAALATVVATQDSVRSAIVGHFPQFTAAQWHADVHAHILPVEVGAPIAAIAWLGLAWANGRGYPWARGLFVGAFGLTSVSLLAAFAQRAATYAPADLIAGCALWLVGLLTLVLILHPRSEPHYRRPPGAHGSATPPTAGWSTGHDGWRTGGAVSPN